MMRATILTAVVLLSGFMTACTSAAQAPTDVNAPRTLPEYLTYAARRNADLQAAFEQWKGALEEIPQAEALPDPTFSYGYFVERVENRQQVGIMQMFPWFGKIAARTDAAAAAAKAAQRRYEARRLQLVSEVASAFYEYVYLAVATRIARENIELMQRFEEVARAKYITAAGTHPDIIRAQIAVAELQDSLITWERLRQPTVVRLNALLNCPSDLSLPWPVPPDAVPADVDRGVLVALLRQNNPELQAARFDIERLSREVDLAKREGYPDIGLGVEWMDMDSSMMPDDARGDDEILVGIQLNIPIWRSRYRAMTRQARAEARRATHERQALENDLLARTERLLYEFDDSGRKLRLYRDVLIPKTEELVAASEAAYMGGTVDFLSLIDAQQTLLEYQLQRERVLMTRRQTLAELEKVVGTDLSGPDLSRTAD